MDQRLFAYGTAAGVFAIDRLTKSLIREHVSAWDTHAVIPGFFNIIHAENAGASFSMFENAQPEWRMFFLVGLSAAALVLIAFLLWHPGGRLGDGWMLRTGLSLIMGGALGNLYDRIFYGTVTDFLEFYISDYHWPAFNAADTAITIGAALVVLDALRSRSRRRAAAT